MKYRGWLGSTKIGRWGWPGSMRNDKPRWLKKQTPPSKKSSSDELNWLSQTAALVHLLCSSHSLHEWSAGHHCATRRRCQNDYHCTQAREDHRSQTPKTVQLITLGLHLLHCLPCWISSFMALPKLDAHLLDSLLAPHRKSETAPPAAYLVFSTTSGPMVDSQGVAVRSEHSSIQDKEDTPTLVLEAESSTGPQRQEPTSPLQVQPRPLLILTMVQWQEPWGVPGIRTVRAVPTTVGPHLIWTHPERMWSTLIWSQPVRIVSNAWTKMR